MKYKGLWNLLHLIYANFWYVPLLVFLIGLKLCLISILINCIESSSESVGSKNRQDQKIINEFIIPLKSQLKLNSNSSKQNSFKRNALAPRSQKKSAISPEILKLWATLANLETARISPSNSNRTDPESIWLIFNRIPRCGGITLVKLLEKLGERNGFAHQQHEYRTPWPRFLVEQEQESLVTWFEYQHLPKSYDRHFYFVNFTRFQKYVKEKPIYINLMRDPVLRIRSDFFNRRSDRTIAQMEIDRRDRDLPGSGMLWFHKDFEDCVLTSDPECEFPTGTQDFTLATPFFCGQHNSCVIINDKWGLQMAKFTIEKHYSVVGVLERMDQTLSALENYVPKFFSGITNLYNQLDDQDKNPDQNLKNTSPLSDSVRQIIETKLHSEVDLYRFVNQRLDLQLAHIYGVDSDKNIL